jgi:phosphoribosyl 1,2-cyclic phosphodiesterase
VEILILASGSSGNAAVVRSGDTSLLVDVGVSALQVRKRLEVFGRSIADVSAIVLTHEHSDHVRGVEVLLKRDPLPVWATAGTWSELPVRTAVGGEVSSGRTRRIGNMRVTPVATSHDAREPVAFVIDDGRHRLGYCTDTGVFTALLEQRLAGCDLLCLESNHDSDMLRNGPYPWPLKQRIASRTGHLANHQTEEAVQRLRCPELRAVVGLHLSAENNRPDLVRDLLHGCSGTDTQVDAVPRTEMLRVALDGDRLEFERRSVPPSRRRTL